MVLEEGPTGTYSGLTIYRADNCWLFLLLATALFSPRTRFSLGKFVVSAITGAS